jgi:competence protein ComEC
VQVYFILANLIAVPLASIWVMPWGLAALALMPFGWEWLAFIPLVWGIDATIWIARATAALPAATFGVPSMPLWGLVVYVLGLVWLCVWRGRWRLLGVPAILLGLLSPPLHRPADILVSADARLIALRVDGETLFRQEGSVAGFIRDNFARYWASAAPIRLPVADTPAIACDDGLCRLHPRRGGGDVLLLMQGERIDPEACDHAALVIAAVPLRGPCPDIPFVDRFTVWRGGAQAIWLDPAGPRLLSDRQDRGDRPWVEIPLRRRPELPSAETE